MGQKKIILYVLSTILLISLVYTRFINLRWGLPYPFHPDERNMADAISRIGCPGNPLIPRLLNCFDPHFYAYGQITLYLAYAVATVYSYMKGTAGVVTFDYAVIALRLVSAFSSVTTFFVMMRIFEMMEKSHLKNINRLAAMSIFVFSPVLIQFAHFGTTESFLMFLYITIAYLCLSYWLKKTGPLKFVFFAAIVSGIAVGAKVSSIIFAILPLASISWTNRSRKIRIRLIVKRAGYLLLYMALTAGAAIAASPYNLLNLREFQGSMDYETGVARGLMKVFYTRQFEETVPVLFQLRYSFPYALGFTIFLLSIAGFIFLSFRKKEVNILRLAFLIAFIPASFLYAKWTRFIAPAYPIALIIAASYFCEMMQNTIEFWRRTQSRLISVVALWSVIALFVLALLPGIAYLSIYTGTDVRYLASAWVYRNMPENSLIFSETANVVDVPIQPPGGFADKTIIPKPYRYISFNSYDVDDSFVLQQQMDEYVKTADYIFVPSRRVFMNHTCLDDKGRRSKKMLPSEEKRCRDLEAKYPVLNKYYNDLFSGLSGYEKVSEFTSFPKIEIFGFKILELPDEAAEETWTVFDHPVMRIYKKISFNR